METIRLDCPTCGRKLKVEKRLTGKNLLCPRCKGQVTIAEKRPEESASVEIEGQCPYCGKKYFGHPSTYGAQTKCSGCGQLFIIGSDQRIAQQPGRRKTAYASSSVCPQCRTPIGSKDIVCVNCGLELKTGRVRETVIVSEHEAVQHQRPESPKFSLLVAFLNTFPGLLSTKTVVLSIMLLAIGYAVMLLGLYILMLGAMFAAMSVMAGGLIVCVQALAWLMVGELLFLIDALAELDAVQWNAMVFLIVGTLVGFFGVFKFISGW